MLGVRLAYPGIIETLEDAADEDIEEITPLPTKGYSVAAQNPTTATEQNSRAAEKSIAATQAERVSDYYRPAGLQSSIPTGSADCSSSAYLWIPSLVSTDRIAR